MMMLESQLRTTFKLNNGDVLPAVGIGCWMGQRGEGADVTDMVKTALSLGYRHIDTAADYGNEKSVGRAIRESGVPREEIYVTTKLAGEDHCDPVRALDESLRNLGLDYVDMYLLHWPMALRSDGSALQPDESPTYIETWHVMESLLQTGKTKGIGVSNFSEKTLSQLLGHPKTSVVPTVNQVEVHPCLPQRALLGFCQARGIQVVAYAPVGKYKFAHDQDILGITHRVDATPAQVMLSWAVQRGTAVVPKSLRAERLRENLSIIQLCKEDMEVLDRVHLKPGMHRSVCGFHSTALGGSCFGWTYEQLGWNFGCGGIMKDSR